MGTHGAVSLTTLEVGVDTVRAVHVCKETTLDGYCIAHNWEAILTTLLSERMPEDDMIGSSVHEFGNEREREQEHFIGVNHITKVISMYGVGIQDRHMFDRLARILAKYPEWEIDGNHDCDDDSPCWIGWDV